VVRPKHFQRCPPSRQLVYSRSSPSRIASCNEHTNLARRGRDNRPFSADTKYFGRPEQAFMVNFRVRNLDAMVSQLRRAGIEVEVDPKTYPHGRFARLNDPDGTPIQLWEPQKNKS
jgi:catechol 2,3-dioxygenase-like lactoylglutathione lyase family enzyme